MKCRVCGQPAHPDNRSWNLDYCDKHYMDGERNGGIDEGDTIEQPEEAE
jgi:hypothetical protein